MIYWCLTKPKKKHCEHLRQVRLVHEHKQLYGNLMKCSFCTLEVVFLGYTVSAKGIQVVEADHSKVDAIKSWSVPSSMHDVRSFHGLASFYKKFMCHFSSIASP